MLLAELRALLQSGDMESVYLPTLTADAIAYTHWSESVVPHTTEGASAAAYWLEVCTELCCYEGTLCELCWVQCAVRMQCAVMGVHFASCAVCAAL